MESVRIDSEIGKLRRVIIHNPGSEIEAMTPREAERDLYNDIIPLFAVQREYAKLRDFLRKVTKTYELADLLAECLANENDKLEFLKEYSHINPIAHIVDQLALLPAQQLAQSLLAGIIAPKESLAQHLNPHSFIANPLPNAYFMRDSVAIIGNQVISAAFTFDVRMAEAYITRFIFKKHPAFRNNGLLIDGPAERNRLFTIEGGDIHVLSSDVLAIGISERTTAFAIDRIAQRIARAEARPITIFAIDLPKERATIHLDMVFTMIDRNAALAYKPVMLGAGRAQVYKLDVQANGSVRYSEEKSLFEGLRGVGIDLEPILCGNGHSVFQEREQWLSGANSFAFGPGKILMYSCNAYTLEALNAKGFAILPAQDFLDGKANPDDYARLAVAFDGIELARGGGGARCMTLPVERDSL
ncbi:MAG: arginine deiminase family protein [Spirochaetota bacterium]